MIWCKYIQKIRDNNGIIVEYEIADLNGEHRIVSKDALKNAIAAGQVSMVNLKLSKDGKLMDRAIEEQAKLMQKLHLGVVTEADNNTYLKAKMIGMAPSINEKGTVTGYPTSDTVAITPNIKYMHDDYCLRDKTIVFYGNNEVGFMSSVKCKRAIVKNPTVVTAIVNNRMQAEEIIFDFDDMDLKLIDIIFKHFKSDEESYKNMYEIITVDESRMDCKEVYNKVASILKRQKPSSKYDRRCYDIIVYLRLIYCMYLSFGDKAVLSLAVPYIKEYKEKYEHIYRTSDWHSVYVVSNRDSTKDLIAKIEGAIC